MITCEKLTNNYYRLFDRGSKLSGLYKPDGTHYSGDLRVSITSAQELIKALDTPRAKMRADKRVNPDLFGYRILTNAECAKLTGHAHILDRHGDILSLIHI